MSSDDYALIVGINFYPGLLDEQGKPIHLQSPENDARAFEDWVASRTGGDVPRANIQRVLSSGYPNPVGVAPEDVMPCADELTKAFVRLKRQASAGTPRRLYAFFSGHGFSPNLNAVALFTARASIPDFTAEHVHADGWMDWFAQLGLFQEVVLFADCCRAPMSTISLQSTGLYSARTQRAARRFYAYAVRYGFEAAQVQVGNQMHGAFTACLLDGLREGAVDRATGDVTTDRLYRYLQSALGKRVQTPASANGNVGTEPDFGPRDDISLCNVGAPGGFSVVVKAPASAPQLALVKVFDGRGQFIKDVELAAGQGLVSLGFGLFKFVAGDTVVLKEIVAGTEVQL